MNFVPVTSLKFADSNARKKHNILSNTLFGLSGNLTGKSSSSDALYLAVDSDEFGAPIVEIAIAVWVLFCVVCVLCVLCVVCVCCVRS